MHIIIPTSDNEGNSGLRMFATGDAHHFHTHKKTHYSESNAFLQELMLVFKVR